MIICPFIILKQLRVTSVLEKRGEIGHLPVNYALRRQAPHVAIVSVVQFYPKKRCPVLPNPMSLSILHIFLIYLTLKCYIYVVHSRNECSNYICNFFSNISSFFIIKFKINRKGKQQQTSPFFFICRLYGQ